MHSLAYWSQLLILYIGFGLIKNPSSFMFIEFLSWQMSGIVGDGRGSFVMCGGGLVRWGMHLLLLLTHPASRSYHITFATGAFSIYDKWLNIDKGLYGVGCRFSLAAIWAMLWATLKSESFVQIVNVHAASVDNCAMTTWAFIPNGTVVDLFTCWKYFNVLHI